MSHTTYPNAYQLPQSQFSSFQQPQHAGTYTPDTNSTTYPNAYGGSYQQSSPSRTPWSNGYNDPSQFPATSQPPRPLSAQAQNVDLTSTPYSTTRAHSPAHPQPIQGFEQLHQSSVGSAFYPAARPTPPTRAESAFAQLGQPGLVTYSPVLNQQSPTRRPLPTPHSRPTTNPIPDTRPSPTSYHVSPSVPSTPFHRPSYSTSAAPTSSTFSTGSVESGVNSPNGGSQFSGRSSRPLPTPIPRSTRSVDLTRSTTPVKDVLSATSPLPPPGQKFIPLWKRSLPAAPQPSNQSSPALGQRPSVPIVTSGYGDDRQSGLGLQRAGSAIRPLPPSPVQTQAPQSGTPHHSPIRPGFSRESSVNEVSPSSIKPPGVPSMYDHHRVLPGVPHSTPRHNTAPNPPPKQQRNPVLAESSMKRSQSPQSSESDDMYENSLLQRPLQVSTTRPQSPSFGSRELPARSSFDRQPRPAERETSQPPGAPRKRRMSIVSRIAEMSLNGSSPEHALSQTSTSPGASPPKREHPMPAMSRPPTQPNTTRWPSELPPLPRTPQIQSDPGYAHTTQSSRMNSQPPRFSPPQPPLVSPPRSRFIPQARSRDNSPSRSTPQAPLGSLPPSHPSSPTRPRFPPQAPPRDPALPAPHAQRMFPNLDDAPPPSLRRSPSPIRASTFPLPAPNGLPSIRTQNMGNSGLSSAVMSPPSAVTPSSASSVISLSSFPAPPQMAPQWRSNSHNSGPSRGSVSRTDSVPRQSVPAASESRQDDWDAVPSISVSTMEHEHKPRIPKISFPMMDDDEDDTVQIPMISVGGPDDGLPQISVSSDAAPAPAQRRVNNPVHPLPTVKNKGGLFCGGCNKAILGRSINTMGANWHPGCFRCASCDQLLENLAMFEHEHRLFCSLCYYENFAPRCYHCQTAIADQDYITLSETDGLGKRTYHTQHFFCAECGDPFLPPSATSRNFSGDGTFDGGAGEGFTVHNGHPYCERCHVRLRMPKCKKCKKPIRKDMDALEVLGGKWCPECFVCKACDGPFINGRFFLRDEKPFCQHCFEIIIKSEL